MSRRGLLSRRRNRTYTVLASVIKFEIFTSTSLEFGNMKVNCRFSALGLMFLSACNAPDTGILQPELAFRIDGENGLAAARDLTVDNTGNVFIFDYDDYVIRKFDQEGAQLAAFGGSGEEPGLFQHLMAIRAIGDSLVALDAGSMSVFDLSGEFRSRRSFVDTAVCDLPRIARDGRWAGEWIIEGTAEKVLTVRNADGAEIHRPESFALGEFYPGLEAGELFFINPTQLRTYFYDFDDDGRLVWAVSDRLELFVDEGGVERQLFQMENIAFPYPPEEIAALEARQAASEPPFFLNVPSHFQLVHQLVVADAGDIWLYVKSQEHTGLLRVSSAGQLTGSYQLEAEFDPLSARLAAANGYLYFLAQDRGVTEVFVINVP
jgi:hypothetical protein